MQRLASGCDMQLHNSIGHAAWSWFFDAEYYDHRAAGRDSGGESIDATLLCDLAGASGVDSTRCGSRRGTASSPHPGNTVLLRSVCVAPAATRVQQQEHASAVS